MPDEADPFKSAVAQRAQLLERLASIPPMEVSGVVSPSGVSGGKVGREELWTLRFVLRPWRVSGREIHGDALTVIRRVSNAELHRLREVIKPYAVVRIRVRVSSRLSTEPEGLFEEFLGFCDVDTELFSASQELQKPVTHQDNAFGILTLDRRVNWWSCKTKWNDGSITLNVACGRAGSLIEGLSTAHDLWKDQDRWEKRVKDYAALRLLALRNDAWSDEDEQPLDVDQFKDRMTLESITVYPDGDLQFWYNDGDLFWGHAIHVSGSLAAGPTDADTPG